jgi:hypothetical protein
MLTNMAGMASNIASAMNAMRRRQSDAIVRSGGNVVATESGTTRSEGLRMLKECLFPRRNYNERDPSGRYSCRKSIWLQGLLPLA